MQAEIEMAPRVARAWTAAIPADRAGRGVGHHLRVIARLKGRPARPRLESSLRADFDFLVPELKRPDGSRSPKSYASAAPESDRRWSSITRNYCAPTCQSPESVVSRQHGNDLGQEVRNVPLQKSTAALTCGNSSPKSAGASLNSGPFSLTLPSDFCLIRWSIVTTPA